MHGVLPPLTDRDSDAWWESLAAGQLTLPHCPSCGATWFPATPGCPECGESHVDFIVSGGHGRLYSWVVVNRALNPAFAHDVPYTIVAVDLDEGARMVGRLRTDDDAPLRAGESLDAQIYTAGGQALVGFDRLDVPARDPATHT
jgi:uncharacterized OB-fold protein